MDEDEVYGDLAIFERSDLFELIHNDGEADDFDGE